MRGVPVNENHACTLCKRIQVSVGAIDAGRGMDSPETVPPGRGGWGGVGLKGGEGKLGGLGGGAMRRFYSGTEHGTG